MEENSSSVGETKELIGTSSVEGLHSLRTLSVVSRKSNIPPVRSGWQCTWNTIFPKCPMIFFLLSCVLNLILLLINNAIIQTLHHEKMWIQVCEFRADGLFTLVSVLWTRSHTEENPHHSGQGDQAVFLVNLSIFSTTPNLPAPLPPSPPHSPRKLLNSSVSGVW